jgi:hypothetical protein
MITFNEWIKLHSESSWNDKFKGTAQERHGYLQDWIEANKDFITVKKGYGDCEDCVLIYLDPNAEDEARRHHFSANFDVRGLSRLKDYVLTSRVSGNGAVLMPIGDDGYIVKQPRA